ncbi:MAG: CoA pyrophosphatase [Cyclobacteriaceae bacterium]
MAPSSFAGSRPQFKHSKPPRKGAVLIMLYEKNGEIHFPLIQRPLYEGVHSGQMALPGGRYEEEDESLISTALRETHEEVGISPDTIEVIGSLSEFMVTASNHLILPVVGFANQPPTFVANEVEVAEIIEAPLSQLLDERRIKEKEIVTAHGYRLRSPYFDLEDKVVWGATAMMLSEFATILKEL